MGDFKNSQIDHWKMLRLSAKLVKLSRGWFSREEDKQFVLGHTEFEVWLYFQVESLVGS